jgi:hypothetical protein
MLDNVITGTVCAYSRDMSHTTSPRFPFTLGTHADPIGVDIIDALSSPEDGIKKSLTIDMKDLVGDAVGNVRSVCSNVDLPHLDVDEHRSLIP